MPMETRHDLEHTTERLTEGLRCPWKWGQCAVSYGFNHVVTTFSPSSIVNNTSGSLSVRAGVMSETEVAAQ